MPRSLASLTITFGLVAIPIRLFSVTKRSAALRFKWMTPDGAAVRQRLIAEPAARREWPPDRFDEGAHRRDRGPSEAGDVQAGTLQRMR